MRLEILTYVSQLDQFSLFEVAAIVLSEVSDR